MYRVNYTMWFGFKTTKYFDDLYEAVKFAFAREGIIYAKMDDDRWIRLTAR